VILLSNVTSVLQLITGSAQVVDVSASWMDATNPNVVTPGEMNTSSSSATTTIIVPSPPVNTQRNIKYVSIANTDPINPVNVTIQHFDGSTTSIIQTLMSLPAGYAIFYEDGRGWYMMFQGAVVQRSRNP
jgi:hypothetical protein